MQITEEQFRRCFPKNPHPADWADALCAILPRYGINTALRLAAFLAQCGHESEGFTAIRENLNYSAHALAVTWPKRFPWEVAEAYAHQPELIANRAYAGRLGNGPEDSGDGWRYRGRGVIQITGRDNYFTFAHVVGRPFAEIVTYLETRAGAVESACWYWRSRGLNAYADRSDMLTLTKRINGGTLGLADRTALYAHIKEVFS